MFKLGAGVQLDTLKIASCVLSVGAPACAAVHMAIYDIVSLAEATEVQRT